MMMNPRPRGPMAHLLTEKQISAEPLEDGYRFTCQQCGAQWVPTLRADGRLPTGYWRCPNGCNAPAEPLSSAPTQEAAPVVDLASLPALLTAEEVGAVLRLHPTTVKLLMRQGELPGRKIGGQWRLLRDDLLAYLGAGLTGQPAQDGTHSAPRKDPDR